MAVIVLGNVSQRLRDSRSVVQNTGWRQPGIGRGSAWMRAALVRSAAVMAVASSDKGMKRASCVGSHSILWPVLHPPHRA